MWQDHLTMSISPSPAVVSCLPAALQVLSVTFELWAQLHNERNEGLDRKWQQEMSPSWMENSTWFHLCCAAPANADLMSRAWLWSLIVRYRLMNVPGYYQGGLCIHRVTFTHLTGTRWADSGQSEAKLSLLAPFLVPFTVFEVNGNWIIGQIVFIP